MHIINFNFLTFWRNLKLNWTNSSSDVNRRSLQKTLQFPFVEPSLPQICLDCEWAIKWGCAEARLSFNIAPRQFAKYQLSSNLPDEKVEQMLNSKRLRVVELWGRRNRRLLVMINVASWSLLSASLSESKLNGSRSLNVIFVTVLFILKAPISRPDDYIKTLDHPWNCAYALIRYIMFR